MTSPTDGIGVVDLMIGFPRADSRRTYEFMAGQLKDAGSADLVMPAGYMFTDVPKPLSVEQDPVAVTLGEMDKCGVAIGLVGLGTKTAERALKEHPQRFKASLEIDPNDITGTVRRIRQAFDEHDIKAVSTFPAGCNPQVDVSDRRYYPIYQTCIDLDIAMIANAGVAGPRV